MDDQTKKVAERKPIPFDEVVRRLLKAPASPASKRGKARAKRKRK
jgi:hypothetical protein